MKKNPLGGFFKVSGLASFLLLLNACQEVPLLDPKGPIGSEEKSLIVISFGLMLIVAIPVFAMIIWFSIRYRESNTKATYKPHWEGNLAIEAVIWLVPVAIIAVLSYLTWTKTIELDPYRPISSNERPVRVQVVSLDWNWLFIYPEQDIATVNKLVIPANTPVTFDLTSATVMTSFFIPHLGSQMYAMGGMVTHLNLLADSPGTFKGQNMEYSGDGYAAMHFTTTALSKDQFVTWVQDAKRSPATLTLAQFNTLHKPLRDYPETTYASAEPGLFRHIVGLFTGWQGGDEATGHHTTGEHSTKPEASMPSQNMNSGTSTMPMTTPEHTMPGHAMTGGATAMPMTNTR